jgi:lyso-ornithine lipid O-acyltransferase
VVSPLRATGRQAARAGGLVALTGGMLPLMLADVGRRSPAEREAVRDAWVRRWARALLRLFAIEVVVSGTAPPVDPRRGRLIVANHRSTIDIGVLLATFGGTMVSRSDLAGWPVVGAAARAVGTVFVDRADAKSGAGAIRTIQRHLERGRTIAIFPEGTTFDGDEVRPFRGGAFVAAVRAEAEVLPVGLAYPRSSGAAFVDETFAAHLSRLAKSDATRMALAIGEPYALTRGARAATVAARLRREIQDLVAVARARAGP